MGFWPSIFLLLSFVGVVVFHWQRLCQDQPAFTRPRLLLWIGRGLLVPVAVWLLLNLDLVPFFPPLLPEVAAARSGSGPWVAMLMDATGPVFWAIGSCWAGVTFAWLAGAIVRHAKDRAGALRLLGAWSCLTIPAALVIMIWLGWPGAGLAVAVWLAPAVHQMTPLLHEPPLPPNYSRAVANMKFGKYNEAEWEVITELEKCEDDFEGWMMLAELYANQFHDLSAATQTVREVCSQPSATASQIAVALHRLADWHLKIGEDPVAARRALEEIGERFPGSHLDKMARLRIRQLPASQEELREQRRGKTFRLPVFRDDFETTARRPDAEMPQPEAAARANRCVEKLKQNPNDVGVREEFAKLLAEQLSKVDLALEQLALLLAMPDQPPVKQAEWLGVMAAWQFRYRGDEAAARRLLERLLHEHPRTPQAFEAQRRINVMAVAERMRKGRDKGVRTAQLPE